jgi:oxygen-dependent protoporphyrinogen oxidase
VGEEALLQRDDADLAQLAAADFAAATGASGPPVAARVTRWGGALPQYGVGHRGRVARIRAAVAAEPGLAVCGAAYDGIGVPACVASAQAAARQILATWTGPCPRRGADDRAAAAQPATGRPGSGPGSGGDGAQ